jgi:hypothetical protein
MQHLTEEEIISHYYREFDARDAESHLTSCAECRAQYDTIRGVLALVNEAAVPERSEGYGEQVWNRLRWKLGSERRRLRGWQSLAAVAAMLAVAFFAGQLWRARQETIPTIAGSPAGPDAVAQKPAADAQNRILLIVLSEHLDTSERVLLEFVNADPADQLRFADQQKRAGELVSANRIYRTTAAEQGDDRVTDFLSDLEPVLMEIANAGPEATTEKIAQLQKRIESRGLLFKVRVLSAQVTDAETNPAPIDSDTL